VRCFVRYLGAVLAVAFNPVISIILLPFLTEAVRVLFLFATGNEKNSRRDANAYNQ
jgi:hypothetical protein